VGHDGHALGRAGSTGEALSLVCGEDRPLLGAIERLINRKIEVRHADGFAAEGRPSSTSAPERERAPAPRGRRQQGEQPQRKPAEQKPAQARAEGESRKSRGEPRPPRQGRREERAPRYASAPAQTTSGNSGGMDFSKPYEPSTTSAAMEAAAPERPSTTRKSTQAIPALFRRKAA